MSQKHSRPICLFDILVSELHETANNWGPDLKSSLCHEIVAGFFGFKSYTSLLEADKKSDVDCLHLSDMPWLPLRMRIFTDPSDVTPNLPLAYERALKGLMKKGDADAEKGAKWVYDFLDVMQNDVYKKLYYDLKYQIIKQGAIGSSNGAMTLPFELLDTLSKNALVESIERRYGSSIAKKYQQDVEAAIKNPSRWCKSDIDGSPASKVNVATIKAVLFDHFYYGLNINQPLTRESLNTYKRGYAP